MSTDKMGGPAFPTELRIEDRRGRVIHYEGMTILDYFAGQALAGTLANSDTEGATSQFAVSAYVIAAAMLVEKQKREADAN